MRWRILGLLFLARIGLGFQFQSLASVGDGLIFAFGLDYAEVGLLIGLFMAPGLLLAIPAGLLGRLIADRQMMVLGLLCLALGGLVSSFSTGGTGVGLGRVIAGAGFLFTTLYFTKAVSDWFEGKEIATAMSILAMSWPFGIAMGQIGHAWLAEAFTWRAPFQVASAYCLVMALAVLALYRTPDHHAAPHPSGTTQLTRQEWHLILCAGCAWGAFNAAYVIYLTFGPKILEGMGNTAVAAAGIISVGSWLMVLSGTFCGHIVDRYGRRDQVMTLCMIGAIAALALLSLPGAGLMASLLFGLIGMAPAGVLMALAGLAVRPQVRAFGIGVFFTVYYAFMLLTPPAAGALFDLTNSTMGPLCLAMVLFAGGLALALGFTRIESSPGRPS